nr:unnamed protein product [uncultured bacterium]
MAHVKHLDRGSVGRLTHEWERDKKPDGTWAFEPTGKIDPSRTCLNYKLGTGRADVNVKARLADPGLKVARRKDLNVISSWVITCPQELKDSKADREKFFRICYEFLQDRYGAENVMQGYVHMDETTPHMHVPTVPVADGRVSAKALYNRRELHNMQRDLDARCAAEWGQKGLVLNGRTAGNYTVEELKQRDVDRAAIEADRRAAEDARAAAEQQYKQAARDRQRAAEELREARRIRQETEMVYNAAQEEAIQNMHARIERATAAAVNKINEFVTNVTRKDRLTDALKTKQWQDPPRKGFDAMVEDAKRRAFMQQIKREEPENTANKTQEEGFSL